MENAWQPTPRDSPLALLLVHALLLSLLSSAKVWLISPGLEYTLAVMLADAPDVLPHLRLPLAVVLV